MKRRRRIPPGTPIIPFLKSLDLDTRRAALALLGGEEREAVERDWPGWAHEGQAAPAGDVWSVWVMMAGRGFGKTLAGAKWITAQIAAHRPARGEKFRIALVGATVDDARRVMVEGKSGLLEVAGQWVESWVPSMRRLTFVTGAEATLFSGASPDMLRGPEHHIAWCDELAKWEKPQECWDTLQLGLRLGRNPRTIVTTTPKPGLVLRAIMDAADTVKTGGTTRDNPHLPERWKQRMEAQYAGTRQGRQELEGELLTDAAGALWTVEVIERCRISLSPSGERAGERGISTSGSREEDCPSPSLSPEGERSKFTRTLIAVDPPSGDGTCGIIACARDADGIAHVLADHSVTARSPDGWARAVSAAAAAHATTEVIAEANQGGKMVKAVLLGADEGLRVRLVSATHGKSLRAEPVSRLFEAGKARLHGRMDRLEAELLGMIAGGGYEGPGNSPDRADAMVWGVGEVMREVGARVRAWDRDYG